MDECEMCESGQARVSFLMNRRLYSQWIRYVEFMSAEGLDVSALLSDSSRITPLECSDGNWRGVAASLGPSSSFGENQRLAAFRLHILRSLERAPRTRRSAWRKWRGILT